MGPSLKRVEPGSFLTLHYRLRDADGDYRVGDVVRFPAPDGQSIAGIVRGVDDDAVVFDFNHPFAGRAVTFDVKLIGVL